MSCTAAKIIGTRSPSLTKYRSGSSGSGGLFIRCGGEAARVGRTGCSSRAIAPCCVEQKFYRENAASLVGP